jgi:hypothetical protein
MNTLSLPHSSLSTEWDYFLLFSHTRLLPFFHHALDAALTLPRGLKTSFLIARLKAIAFLIA